MELKKGLLNFLNEAISESMSCTVEGSFPRMLTNEEINYMNKKIQPYGFAVNCFRCETCEEYTEGNDLYHIERISLTH